MALYGSPSGMRRYPAEERAGMKHLNEMTLEELWQLFPIALSDHRAEWADRFARERRRILSFLPNDCRFPCLISAVRRYPGSKRRISSIFWRKRRPRDLRKSEMRLRQTAIPRCRRARDAFLLTGDIPSTALRKRSFTFICAMRGITKNCCFGII